MKKKEHIPVLLDAFLRFFEHKNIEAFADGTLGAAGHSSALLKAHPEMKKLIGFDQDVQALEIAREVLKPYQNIVELINKNFCEMPQELDKLGSLKLDGILLDIGVSSMQLDRSERGFSFSKDGPLDMRMDRGCELTAEEIVNRWSEKELGQIFREYGEVAQWRWAAKAIVEARKKHRITTTSQLVELLGGKLRKSTKKSINPLTLVFQALRIAVNNELEVLSYALPKLASYLKAGARLCVISFHSGEDRIVKNVFRDLCKNSKEFQILTKKPITVDEKEQRANPRSRSAKLRVLEKCGGLL